MIRRTIFYILTNLVLLLTITCCNTQTTQSDVESNNTDSINIAVDSSSSHADTTIEEKEILSIKKEFKADKKDSLSLHRAKIQVPEVSLKTDKEISITAIDSTQMAKLPTGMVNVTSGSAGYRFLPHGEHFIKNAATIILPFDSTKIPQGYTAKDIHTYYYNEKYKRWDVLQKDTIDIKNQLAYSRTEHFTDMINGILKVPESPETGS